MTTPTLPPLTRALVAGLAAGADADAWVVEKIMGGFCAEPDSLSEIPETRYWLHKNGVIFGEPYKLRCSIKHAYSWTDWLPSTDLNASARMEQRLRELGKHKDYMRHLLSVMGFFTYSPYYEGAHCLKLESHFELVTAPALLRVKAALFLFCEE